MFNQFYDEKKSNRHFKQNVIFGIESGPGFEST